MMNSFYTGVGGVKAQQFGIDVWGNNIANINTVGFRSSTPEFASLLSGVVSGVNMSGMDEFGVGVTAQTTSLSSDQGSFKSTDRTLDLAIGGNGWFGLQNPENTGEMIYTRAGAFFTDAAGSVVDQNGYKLMGTYSGTMTLDGKGGGTVSTASIANANMLTTETAQVPLELPSALTHPGFPAKDAVMGTVTPNIGFTLSSVPAEFKYTLPKEANSKIEILDANGNVISTTVQESKKAGEHTFTWDGRKDDNSVAPSGSYSARVSYVDVPAVPAVKEGNLTGYEIDANGVVTAAFDNGYGQVVAQIPLFHFQNEQGLTKISDTIFSASSNSGEAIFYRGADGKVIQEGRILSNTLELGNVLTAEAMTNLIITEKAYTANARVITTADQMIQKAIGLKRG